MFLSKINLTVPVKLKVTKILKKEVDTKTIPIRLLAFVLGLIFL